MRSMLAILILFTAVTATQAADYLDRAVYWCHQNGHTNATLAGTEVLNVVKGEGALSYIMYQADSWKIADPPSKATLDALDEATVDAWIDGYKKGADANFEAWDERLKALAKLCRKEINKIRAAHGQAEYSVAEWKALLKDEM